MVTLALLGGLVGLIAFCVHERREEQKYAWFTPEQVARDRRQIIAVNARRADYLRKIERSWGERFFRLVRRVEVATQLAVTRPR